MRSGAAPRPGSRPRGLAAERLEAETPVARARLAPSPLCRHGGGFGDEDGDGGV